MYFKYDSTKSAQENWKAWVAFRFGNNTSGLIPDWYDILDFTYPNGDVKVLSVKEVNTYISDVKEFEARQEA